MQTIEELLVAVKIDVKGRTAALVDLSNLQKGFDKLTNAAESADKAVSNRSKTGLARSLSRIKVQQAAEMLGIRTEALARQQALREKTRAEDRADAKLRMQRVGRHIRMKYEADEAIQASRRVTANAIADAKLRTVAEAFAAKQADRADAEKYRKAEQRRSKNLMQARNAMRLEQMARRQADKLQTIQALASSNAAAAKARYDLRAAAALQALEHKKTLAQGRAQAAATQQQYRLATITAKAEADAQRAHVRNMAAQQRSQASLAAMQQRVQLSAEEWDRRNAIRQSQQSMRRTGRAGSNRLSGFRSTASMLNSASMLGVVSAGLSGIATAGPGAIAVLGTVGALLAGIGLSRAIGNYESFQLRMRYQFGQQADAKQKEAIDTGRRFGLGSEDLLEGARQAETKGVTLKMQEVAVLKQAAALEQRTLASAIEALADAQVGQFRRLQEYGIKGRSVKGTNNYSLFDAQTGQTQVVNRNDAEGMVAAVMSIMQRKYGGAIQATSNSINAKISGVTDILSSSAGESVWSMFAEAAVSPLYRAWNGWFEGLMEWIQEPATQDFLEALGKFVGIVIETGMKAISILFKVLDFLKPIFGMLLDIGSSIVAFVQVAMDAFASMFSGSIDFMSKKWQEFAEIVWLFLDILYEVARAAVLAPFYWLSELYAKLAEVGAQLWQSFGVPLMDMFSRLLSSVSSWFGRTVDGIEKAVTDWLVRLAGKLASWVPGAQRAAQGPAAAPNRPTSTVGGDSKPPTNVSAVYNITASSPQQGLAAARVNTELLYN